MKKTEFTKTAIINSTVKLLKANGKVTIKEISDDAGVNIAAINYHFTDKKSLISVVIRRTISDFKKIADNLVANLAELNTHPEETISAFFNACHEYCAENINVINFMLAPENVEYNNYFNKTVSQMFSTDSDLCFKVISYRRATSAASDNELKARYLVLLSTFLTPFFSTFNILNGNHFGQIFNLNDQEFKKLYIEQIVRIIKSK